MCFTISFRLAVKMPRMTTDLLVKCTGQAKRKRDESLDQFLRRITHLYCSEKGIETIVSINFPARQMPSNGLILMALFLFYFRKDYQPAKASLCCIFMITSSLALRISLHAPLLLTSIYKITTYPALGI